MKLSAAGTASHSRLLAPQTMLSIDRKQKSLCSPLTLLRAQQQPSLYGTFSPMRKNENNQFCV